MFFVPKFPSIKARHVRVECSFLEVSRVREGELILALNSVNRLTRVHVPHTLSHDVFMFQKFGLAEKETLFKYMAPKDRTWMEIELRKECKHNRRAWYNCPMAILGQLVLKDEYKRMLSTAMARIDRSKLSLDELQIQSDAAFEILYNLDWNAKGLVVTEDNLQMIASSTIGAAKEQGISQIHGQRDT
ncbi:hypothetical protein O6H91_16G071500 [Diphasiastrum complanatum]|uniref:Uncharacterized protein n=1 Tax=Diphasiastrum complanatum TaxID=34168 RepID=A0ACC2BDL6_DIPCM|nr:hypothetical protein O6H91_16G071500 [Diphasiastrum complanatum]